MSEGIEIITSFIIHRRSIKHTARRNDASVRCAWITIIASGVVGGIGTIPIDTLIDRAINAVMTLAITLTL